MKLETSGTPVDTQKNQRHKRAASRKEAARFSHVAFHYAITQRVK